MLSKTLTYRSFLGYISAIWLAIIFFQADLLQDTGFSWEIAWIDAIASNALLIAGYFAMSYVMQYYYKPGRESYLISIIVLVVLNKFLAHFLLSTVFSENADYLLFLEKSASLRSKANLLLFFLSLLAVQIQLGIKEQQENTTRKSDAEKLSKEAELTSLRQQLQPHFLFNSLNSISALIGSQPEKARNMIHQLSDFLRGTLKKDERQLVTLAEELQQLQLYLDIEKVRFGHRLNTLIESNETTGKLLLPPLLLQPIVENAIKFGLYDTTGETTIRITTKKEDRYLVLEIENPFDLQTAKPKQGTGFGLTSIQRRLYLLFARNDLLKIQNNNNLFITTVKIPQSA